MDWAEQERGTSRGVADGQETEPRAKSARTEWQGSIGMRNWEE